MILCALCGLIFLTITGSLGSEKVHALANYQSAKNSCWSEVSSGRAQHLVQPHHIPDHNNRRRLNPAILCDIDDRA